MSDLRLDPPDAELAALYRAALDEEPAMTQEAEERVRSHVAASLFDLPVTAPRPADVATPSANVAAPASALVASTGASKLLLVFALGAFGGAVGHAVYTRQSLGIVESPTAAAPREAGDGSPHAVERVVETASPAPIEPPPRAEATAAPNPRASSPNDAPTPARVGAHATTPRGSEAANDAAASANASGAPEADGAKASVESPTATKEPKDARLASERMQLEAARVALARGDARGALDAIRQYTQRFPDGQLREEAEVVAIQALVRAGRHSDARARAALYRARYPNGFFRQAVDEALGREDAPPPQGGVPDAKR
jgi:hypothetical protein